MDPKLFEQKLSEVAEWHREKHRGHSQADQSYRERDVAIPTYIEIDKIKPQVCEYTGREQRCEFKIYWRRINPSNPQSDLVRIQKCDTCDGLITPKDRYIPLDGKRYDYPRLIQQRDSEDK